MQIINFWRKQFVRSAQIILLSQVFWTLPAAAQLNIYDRDLRYASRPFHFGIEMGINSSNYKVTLDSVFIPQTDILKVEGLNGPGFTLGIVFDLHISPKFDLRFVPDLSFGDKSLQYTIRHSDTFVNKKIESVYLDFPFLLKYKSKPYHDMRMYALAGLKYTYDFTSNATARNAANLVKVVANDVSFDYGIGFEFHLPLVMISPEIKISYGLDNVLKPDPALIYSNVLKRLRTRTFLLCIKFEG